MSTRECIPLPSSRFRIFWTTQPAACGVYSNSSGCIDSECGLPGLETVTTPQGKTLVNTDWIRSLILNILYTAQEWPATPCGRRPGNRGGYWADSYRSDKIKTGSKLYQVKMRGKINESVRLVEEFIKDDLRRLVNPYKVANKVDVKAKYLGQNTVQVMIEVFGEREVTQVAVSGTRLENNWVWN